MEDRGDTFECLFKEHWEIVNENIDFKDSADLLLKKGENKTCRFDSARVGEPEEASDFISSSDISDTEFKRLMGERKAQEYVGWASKALIEFLQSIGTDTTKQLSQFDVETIIFD